MIKLQDILNELSIKNPLIQINAELLEEIPGEYIMYQLIIRFKNKFYYTDGYLEEDNIRVPLGDGCNEDEDKIMPILDYLKFPIQNDDNPYGKNYLIPIKKINFIT